MAQYWLEVASAADLAQLEVVTTGTLSYVTDGGYPAARYAATTAVGEYVRFLGAPAVSNATDVTVRILSKVTVGGNAGVVAGPACRIVGADGFIYGKFTGTAYRPSKSIGGVWTQLSSSLSGQPAGNVWGWTEILSAVSGAFECRGWAEGGERPATAQRSFTDAFPIGDSWCGFGAPSNIGAATVLVRIISVGTDGDPAPTGPVGGERQRSRLILTPW